MPFSILEIARRADQFFMQTSPIHEAMRRLTTAMYQLQIPFAIAGAMAANAHGHRRTTTDVDILIRREDLQRFKEHYAGKGWVDKFAGSRNFRDTISNVNIDVLIVDEFPGDGLAKPIAFPPPETVSQSSDEGIPFISLKTLLELKLASGMTAVHRMQDLADVMNLIRVNQLPLAFGETLHPYVAAKYCELWPLAQVNDDH